MLYNWLDSYVVQFLELLMFDTDKANTPTGLVPWLGNDMVYICSLCLMPFPVSLLWGNYIITQMSKT